MWIVPKHFARTDRLKISSVVFGGSGLVVLWFAALRVEVDDRTVTYRSLLSPTRRIRRADIIHADFANPPRSTEGPFTFVLRTNRDEELRINLKPFPLEATWEMLAIEDQLR